MKPKHTPAPWTNLPRRQCIPICGQHEVGLSLGFISSSNPERTAEGKANAQLIAAAPDLLEALIEVTASLAWNAHGECRAIHDGPIMPSNGAVEMAKAVIAKATA